MFEPIIIKLDYSPRDERHSKQVKSVASRLGKRIGSGLIDRPNIGRNRRRLGSGRIDMPTGGVRGYRKPTGNRFDFDRDGWADEGTTNPVWVGLSSGQDRPRPVIETQRVRPKINLNNKKINERKKIRQKIKYGESSLDGKLISRKSGPKWLDGLSNEQISNILVPDSYQTYSQMLADGFGVDKETIEKYLESRWGVGKPWLEIDYSENSIKELRQALKSALDESPIFSWAVRNYGSPTYTVMTRKSAETYNNRDAVKPLYEALKKMYPDAPGQPQFAASNHLDFEMVTFNPVNVVDKKSWRTNEPISSSFQTSKLPSDSDTVIDRSIPGTILHEWAHWYHSEMLLANIESSESKKRSPKSLINPQDADFAEKVKIALEYNSDNGNMNLHLAKKPLEDSPGEPRTITSYGHVSKKEMFAEGMLAYMHPNEQLKLKAINKKLRQDIETILAGDKGVDAWKDSKANIRREKNILSSGRKNRKLTKLSSGSKTEELKKPTYPRHPSYGPFLDGADDVFADVKNWKEFKEAYDNLEINFFDYETTGLVSDEFQQSSGNGAPVQFGVTKTKGGKEIGRLNIFMNPEEELSDWSRKNLKNKDGEPLTDEWLSSQTSIADAHRKLIEFVGPDAIFGVQNAVFDKTVLEDALTSSGIEWRPKGWVDTKVVADFVIPKWTKENQDAPWTTDRETGEKIPSSSLKALTEYLNIDLGKKHHTADADAAATSELMSKIIDKAIEKNWSSDIFDKNWRDQKTKDKLENHQQKIIDFEQQKNNWISETSPKKSTVPKETEKKEFGFGRLSSGTTSYKGRHESPDASSGAPLHNLANGAIYPEDIYGPNGANLYGGAFPDLAQKAVAIFRKLRNKPDSELTVYRAVPRGKNIKEGDWVTILPEYAKIHGDSWLKDDYEIVTKKVKAKELFNEGNSLLEFGYHSKLSSGKYDGAPTYKGKVWKDRKNELDGPVWPFSYQAKQYPKDGPSGISYFKGVVNESTWVDCLLYRDDSGKLIGILNHYPFALVDPDDPRIVEKRGNINIFIDPKHKNKGIGTKLVDEAVSRYSVDLRRQRYSEEGANFINNYIRKLPENKNKPKLSSGAPEPIKDIWNGDRYIQFQTYKDMEIGFTGEARLRDVPSGKRFVEMKVIDSVDGRLNSVPRDEARTFTEKTISAAIDWLLNRQIQTEAIGSVSRRFILTEEQFKEFLAADIKAAKAKPDPNKKKYPSMKKGFRVDEKELASLSGDKPDNRILVQVPNRFWDDHLSRLDDDFDSPTVRGEFRTETRLNHFELEDLISDADYHIETAEMEEEFDSQGAEQLMDALIKQGIPIKNGELKLSSGKTNRANRRANNSKLSSGSQPRMNLSDEEKREIIAIASQRTDDFSKSVVAQFRRNGKLSDRQWNALNRATLRRSRLSSGSVIDAGNNLPNAKKKKRTLRVSEIKQIEEATKKLANTGLNLQMFKWKWNGSGKEKARTWDSPLFVIHGRPAVVIEVNGVNIPFYVSSGSGGKKNVSAGRWYPFFGISEYDGWFNKTSEEDINDYYGIEEFRSIADILNKTITPSDIPNGKEIAWNEASRVRTKKRPPLDVPPEFVKNFFKGDESGRPEELKDEIDEVIHRDFKPLDFHRQKTLSGVRAHVEKILAKVKEGRNSNKNGYRRNIRIMSENVIKDKLFTDSYKDRIRRREVKVSFADFNGNKYTATITSSVENRNFVGLPSRREASIYLRNENGDDVGLLFAKEGDTEKTRGKFIIADITVNDELQRRGLGRAMMHLGSKYNVDGDRIEHSDRLSPQGARFAAGTPIERLSSGKTNRTNRRANNSKLSSGSTEVSEMGKQRIQRRITAYEEEAEKGDGSELKLPWDKDGKLKEKPIIASEVDDDFDDDEELSKEEKENRAAALEYAKISREEMAERTRRAEESKRRLNSPEYLEQARLRRVARNKGQETITHNADGTIKRKDGEKLSSGSLINSKKYRKKHTALLKKILTKMDKEGAGWMDEDMRLARLDELEYNFGKSLRQTIEYWYGGADGVTYNMRDEIEGGRISKEVNELLSLIDISPVTSRPIYRGMRYMTQDQLDEIINRGVKLPLGAFSGQKTTALSYADGDSFNEAQVSVVLRLEPGVKAFPMKHFSPIDEEEYLVSGTFEVVGVSQTPVGRFGKTVTEVELKEIEDKPKLSSG